jgi:hypothetical protein
MSKKRILLVVLAVVLLSFSGILFSASLTLGKALESPGRKDDAALVRANDRYWRLFPLQLLAVAVVSGIIVVSIPKTQDPRRRSRRIVRLSAFLPITLVLLVFDYLFGIIAFDHYWGNTIAEYLKRP